MAAREEILSALRQAAPPGTEHPELSGVGVRWPDPVARFAEMIAAVGGQAVRVPDLAAADRALRELPQARDARRVVSLVAGVGTATVDAAALADPHQLEGVDLAVLPAELAVAENGAVWIEGAALPHRALVVIPEHLAVVVRAGTIVHDMHQAYARLDLARRRRFGLFLSGPSKTADIEQALVIGAHGARSCTALVVDAG
ncbi:MAG TPA: LUD domain-containing protein [Anaeromyxobacteraceae bacterium]|nr:LUD domain-containing protein [Anaeromyxobacteraceae bacterium]